MRWGGGYLTLGRFRGVAIRVHGSLMALGVLLILIHELGHMVLAQRSHLSVDRIELHILGGKCIYYADRATVWNRSVIAWGGVLAQLVLFAPVYACTKLLPPPSGWLAAYLNPALVVLLPLNLAMVVFNLLPAPFLDGYQAWRLLPMIPGRISSVLRRRRARRRGRVRSR